MSLVFHCVTGVTRVFFITLHKMCHMWHDNNFTSIEFCFTQELRFKGLYHYLFITVFFVFYCYSKYMVAQMY